MNTTGTDIRLLRHGRSRSPYAIRPDQLPRALFVAELVARGLVHVAQDSFHGRAQPAALEELGMPVMIRADPDEDEIEAVIALGDGALALVDGDHGQVQIDVAALTRGGADAGVKRLRERLKAEPPVPERISIAFWMRGGDGGDVRHRQIDAPAFEEVSGNYPAGVRRQLERLVATTEPERGRLILWRGPPGTGKSHALRALARAWAPWCSSHFIMDPEELLGSGGAYLLDVLSWDGDDEDRWRLVILEDAGELIATDARAIAGQALSRLLNVADGLLGQGTRTLLLITTNERLGRLHSAARRPGRCLAEIEFVPFATVEARAWLADRGQSREVKAPLTLAELYNEIDDAPAAVPDSPSRFGFARALDRPPRRGDGQEPIGSGPIGIGK